MEHSWVPTHEIMTDNAVETLIKDYSCNKTDLPKILSDDPVIKLIVAQVGDVVKITRPNGSLYYRLVT